MINRIYIAAAIENSILTEVDDWIEDDDAAAHVQRSEAQKALNESVVSCKVMMQQKLVAKRFKLPEQLGNGK